MQVKGQPMSYVGAEMEEEGEHIYGTTINIRKVMATIERFVLEFEIVRWVEGEVVA